MTKRHVLQAAVGLAMEELYGHVSMVGRAYSMDEPASVQELVERMATEYEAVSRHLSGLQQARPERSVCDQAGREAAPAQEVEVPEVSVQVHGSPAGPGGKSHMQPEGREAATDGDGPGRVKPVAELIPLWKAEEMYDELTSTQQEVLDFLNKVDSKGSYIEYLYWGGVESFPEPLRHAALNLSIAHSAMESAVTGLAADVGLQA